MGSGCIPAAAHVYYLAMCLAVPALITKIEGTVAEADLGGNTLDVNILFTPEVQVGDYVILHAGYALSVMDRKDAEETLELLEQIAESDESH
jgi:hydrogenase expression/formation protein HypC